MKRTLLTVKALAQELGISPDSVYRAYRSGEIPGAQIAGTLRFDLAQVCRVMEKRAKAIPNSQCMYEQKRHHDHFFISQNAAAEYPFPREKSPGFRRRTTVSKDAQEHRLP